MTCANRKQIVAIRHRLSNEIGHERETSCSRHTLRLHLAAMKKYFLLVAATLLFASAAAGTQTAQLPIDNVILITFDGARTEEMFGGMQLDILQSTLRQGQRVEDSASYKRFWAETAKARREKLMPFFWTTLMAERGSIAGNQARGSSVRLTNTHRFSYPGYSEILTGEAHDDVIKSNDRVQNPYPTILEELKGKLGLAAFASLLLLRARPAASPAPAAVTGD